MNNWELNIINRIPNGIVIGFSYFTPIVDSKQFNFYEFNLYLLFVQFQLRWE